MEHSMIEHLFKELELVTDTGCWIYDIAPNKLTWSDQTYKIHAVKKGSEMSIEDGIEFYHFDDRDRIKTYFNSCIEVHKPYRDNFRIIDSEGNLKFVESTGRPFFKDGELVSVFGTFRDVTMEQRLLEDKIKLECDYDTYQKSINDFFIFAETDIKGRIIDVNDLFCEISGYSKDELIGKDHRLINSGMQSKKFFRELWSTIKSGNTWDGVICNRTKNGSLYWVQTYIFPNFDLDNEVVGFTSLRFDVTEKMELDHELGEQREKMTFASQLAAVGEMSAGIAHEVANPLAIIMGQAELIAMKIDASDPLQEKIEKIKFGVKRIDKIIKGLKKLSYQSKTDDLQEISLDNIVSDTLDFCEQSLKNANIELSYEKISDDLTLNCNEVKISQIILNLVNNAKDAIVESQTNNGWIKIIVKSDQTRVLLQVVDSGPGISEENKSKLMESFFTTKSLGKGSGLGLSLVKRFASEHNGKFYYDDTYPEYTCFTVELPRVKS